MQHTLWDSSFAPGPWWLVAAKFLFLLFPGSARGRRRLVHAALHLHVAVPLGRVQFIPTMMLTWWDAVRAVWLYWVGMFRFIGVALGWAVTFSTFVAKLVLEVIRQIVLMPFTMTAG